MGRPTDPDTVYVAALGCIWGTVGDRGFFKTTDGGETYTLERGLWDHPHRAEWGAGFGGQAFHTVLPHPGDPTSVTAAISTSGGYRTTDDGASWHPRSQGISAIFLPEGRPPRIGELFVQEDLGRTLKFLADEEAAQAAAVLVQSDDDLARMKKVIAEVSLQRVKMRFEQFDRDSPQVEALRAAEHGHRNLADLGGGENEFDVLGRLFERLQQRVEGVFG